MPKGLFTKEIQDAVLAGTVDIAVHSLKDLPTELHSELSLAAITARANPYDALISPYKTLAALPSQARIGTTSTRRRSQLAHQRPDLEFVELRGNVDTRLRKLDNQEYDAIILAAAGLTRLGLNDRITELLAPEILLPAVGQGALGIEIRATDTATAALIAPLNDWATAHACTAERAFLKGLGGGCLVPIAAFAEVDNTLQQLRLRGCVASLDGKIVLKDSLQVTTVDLTQATAAALGQQLATQILAAGGDQLLSLH
jgi:hydroxymethylbilane synthase